MKKLLTKEQIRNYLKDNNLKDGQSIDDALKELFKDFIQEALEAEMDYELGYSKYDYKNKKINNSRNGHTKKTIKSTNGNIELQIPRDINRDFEPIIVKKHERFIDNSIEDRIISMYAKGMSDRDIYEHMNEIYKINVSSEMISKITDKIIPLAKEWQNRPLKEVYPIIFLDGTVFNVREDGKVRKKTAYIVFGLTLEGTKEILGIWIGNGESASFWMSVVTDLQHRGVKDILIASVDGLKGFEEAILSVFPNTEIQKCVVHQVRTSTKFVGYKDRKTFCADMRLIYTAPNEVQALQELENFEKKWGKKYAYAVKSWKNNWKNLATFFKYPAEIRKIIYTTNPIENFNRQIKKITKTKSSFPTEDSLLKLLYLVTMDATKKWEKPRYNWNIIINQMIIFFGERITKYLNK
jgi:putative transposase